MSWGDQGGTPSLTPIQGGWNATTNVPTLASGIGTEGDAYQVLTAGTTSIDGENDWAVLDLIWFDGTVWRKLDHSEPTAAVAHALGGSEHTSDTLANVNTKLSDATLIDTADSRLNAFDTTNMLAPFL